MEPKCFRKFLLNLPQFFRLALLINNPKNVTFCIVFILQITNWFVFNNNKKRNKNTLYTFNKWALLAFLWMCFLPIRPCFCVFYSVRKYHKSGVLSAYQFEFQINKLMIFF